MTASGKNGKTAGTASDALTVTVRVMGREYAVACMPDEHEALVASADFLNERMTGIRRRGKALGTERIAVMAALNLSREILALRGHAALVPEPNEAIEKIRQLGFDIDSTLDAPE